jgi:hypothetical protein
VGRALRKLTQTYTSGWQVSNVTNVFEDLSSRFSELAPRPAAGPFLCSCCGDEMMYPGVYSCDAGQAYEDIPTSLVNDCVNRLFERALAKKDFTLHVHRSRGCNVGIGGWVREPLVDRLTIYVSAVYRCVQILLSLRFFRFLSMVAFQLNGIPIGGPISSHVMDLVFATTETEVDNVLWQRVASILGVSKLRRKTIACARYADDVLFVSHWLCAQCLSKICIRTYSNICGFEPALESYATGPVITFKFLDCWVNMSFHSWWPSAHTPNEAFAWSGGRVPKSKLRFAIPVGPKHVVIPKLIADLKTRRARWAQLRLTKFDLKYAICVELAELISMGHKKSFLFSAWQKSGHYNYVTTIGLAFMRSVFLSTSLCSSMSCTSPPLLQTSSMSRTSPSLSQASTRALSSPSAQVEPCPRPVIAAPPSTLPCTMGKGNKQKGNTNNDNWYNWNSGGESRNNNGSGGGDRRQNDHGHGDRRQNDRGGGDRRQNDNGNAVITCMRQIGNKIHERNLTDHLGSFLTATPFGRSMLYGSNEVAGQANITMLPPQGGSGIFGAPTPQWGQNQALPAPPPQGEGRALSDQVTGAMTNLVNVADGASLSAQEAAGLANLLKRASAKLEESGAGPMAAGAVVVPPKAAEAERFDEAKFEEYLTKSENFKKLRSEVAANTVGMTDMRRDMGGKLDMILDALKPSSGGGPRGEDDVDDIAADPDAKGSGVALPKELALALSLEDFLREGKIAATLDKVVIAPEQHAKLLEFLGSKWSVAKVLVPYRVECPPSASWNDWWTAVRAIKDPKQWQNKLTKTFGVPEVAAAEACRDYDSIGAVVATILAAKHVAGFAADVYP